MAWSELKLHRWLAERGMGEESRTVGPPIDPTVGSVGHDAAVLPASKGRPVMCADQCVEGVHFLPEARGRDVGRKAANRALSDLAATGARPQSILLTIAADDSHSQAWMKAVIEGASAAAEAVGASLVGGDLSTCPSGAAISALVKPLVRNPPSLFPV